MTTYSGTVCISDSKMRSYARLRGVHNENLGNKCVTVVSDSRPQLLELSSLLLYFQSLMDSHLLISYSSKEGKLPHWIMNNILPVHRSKKTNEASLEIWEAWCNVSWVITYQ